MSVPVMPHDGTVLVDGLWLHYLDWGNEDAQPMLLLHGTASHAHVWDHFAAALSDEFHVVALDQRGHGDSESPPDYRTGYLQEYWASDIEGVVKAMDFGPMVPIGLSTGEGNNAIHYTAAHPESVERLVVVEMGPEVMRSGAASVAAGKPSREEFDTEEEGIAYLMASNRRADPTLSRAHAQHYLRSLPDGRVALKGDRALRYSDWRRPLRTVQENWDAVHSITCPTLIVRGAASNMLSAEIADRMEREIPFCTLVTIPTPATRYH